MEFSSRPLFFITSAFLTLRLATTTFRLVGLGGGLGLGLFKLFRTFSIFLQSVTFVSFLSGTIFKIAATRRISSFFMSVQILRPILNVFPVPTSETFFFLFVFLKVTFFFLIIAQISCLVARLMTPFLVTLKLTTPIFLVFLGFTPSSKTPVTLI